MLDSELAEHIRRTCERATLDRYVPRRFTTASETGEIPLEEYQVRGVFRERAPELSEVLQHRRLLILAEPGGGKSVVARAAVHECLRAGRIPILLELKEYRGDLPALLQTVAPDGLLRDDVAKRSYILDGIDEVPAECLTSFADDLNTLAKSDTQAPLLATGRQAFYVAHRNLFPELTNVFHLLDFSDGDVRRYAKLSGIPFDGFMRAVTDVDIEEEIANPFALWVMVELFKATGRLSHRRSEMLSAMVDRLIQSRPHINAHRQRRALCMLAVSLEVYSRNEASEEEALRVIRASMRLSDQEARELLDELYGSILRRTTKGVAFQMRSYGEYLAAEELERADLRRVRELAFFDHSTPNDSWMNTVSYLLELNSAVRALFVRQFPFWVLRSSPAVFSETEKTAVASGVLEEFRRQRQYLRIDPRLRIRHLARFVTRAIEEELSQDLTSADEVLCGNALVLLGILNRPDALAVALPIARDRTRGAAIRQCAIIAIANTGTAANIDELVSALAADDPLRENLVDAIGTIANAENIPLVLDLALEANATLSATYYHFRELRSREALVVVLRYLVQRPRALSNNRADGYIDPILRALPDYFDAEIAGLCAEILRVSGNEQHYGNHGPLPTLVAGLREADKRGEVARLFFAGQLQTPTSDVDLFFSIQFVAEITTIETAEWLIQAGATALIQSLSCFVSGPVREMLRPHSSGVIDAQDENARRYAAEKAEADRGKQDWVQELQQRLLTRTKLQEALNDFVELREERWPELPEAIREWISLEISILMVTLDLERGIRWEGEVLWAPPVYRLLIRIITRYGLTVLPNELMIFPAMGMDEQMSVKYYRRLGFTQAALQTLERLLAAPPSPRAVEGLIRLVRDSGVMSDSVRATLCHRATDPGQTIGVRRDALQILAAQGEESGFFRSLRKDPQPAIAEQAFLTLVERQDRETIERELSRLLADDSALKAGEVEVPYDSPLNWLGKIRAEFAWNKLKRLRERALSLGLDRVVMTMTGCLAQIDRLATARLIRQQLDAAPAAWRHFLQASAVEMEQAVRIEKAQQTPFDAVLRKLRGSTSADRLIVVCEGPTDVPVFQALLAQLHDVPEIIFDHVGGWAGLVNKDPNIFLLGAKAAIVVMDGDMGRKLDVQPPPLTDLARGQTARLMAAGVELRILERYGIENYFPREAIEKAIERDLSSFFPLPPDVSITEHLCETDQGECRRFYAKSRNRDVVVNICLDRDLAGTDLRTIIYEIADAGRRLAEV